jgi:hypothetical protein
MAAGATEQTHTPPETPPPPSSAFPWRRLLAAATPGLGLALTALVTRLGFATYHDEGYYLPLARKFAEGLSLDLIRTYDGIPSALGPVFYLVHGLWLRLAGDSLLMARILTVLIGSAVGAVVVEIGRVAGVRHPIWFGLAVLGLPHFATCGITMLSEPMALLGSTLGVYCWLRGLVSERPGWFLVASIPLALAIDVRVTQLALVPALLFVGLAAAGAKAARMASMALALAPQVPVWWLWGGLLPPTQRRGVVLPGAEAQAGINLPTFVHLATVLGFLAWPVFPALAPRIRRDWKLWGLMIACAVGLYLAARPDYSFRFAGPLSTLARVRGGLLRPALAPFAVAGCLLTLWGVLLVLDRREAVVDRALAAVGVAGLGIYVLSPLAFERYALTCSPFWLALIGPRLEDRRWCWALWRAWVVALLVMAVASVAVLFYGPPIPPAGAGG